MSPRVGALFAGYGGLELGTHLALGAEPAWTVENSKPSMKVLAHRLGVPNHGDITTVPWHKVERVDILTGGFPCQDVSTSGVRRGLKPGTRTGLWGHFAYAILRLDPQLVIIENVRGLTSATAHSDMEPCPLCVGDNPDGALRALGAVLGDLADLGYDTRWGGLPAAAIGAPHNRFRIFIVAWPQGSDPGHWKPHLTRAYGQTTTDLFPTPRAQGGHSDGPSERRRQNPGLAVVAADLMAPTPLLPTPAVNDMGEGKTLDWWAEWAPRQKSADGSPSPHSDSLSIVARQLLPTPNTITSGEWSRTTSSGDHLPGVVQKLLPTPDTTGREDSRTSPLLPGALKLDWRQYSAAITHWESLTRPAPPPTEIGPKGDPVLSPRFEEWMMGLPDGWVTQVPDTTRNQHLRMLGNGVVPQQAAHAISLLLDPP